MPYPKAFLKALGEGEIKAREKERKMADEAKMEVEAKAKMEVQTKARLAAHDKAQDVALAKHLFDELNKKQEFDYVQYGGKKKKGSYLSSLLLIFSLYKSGNKKKNDVGGKAELKWANGGNVEGHFKNEEESDDENGVYFKFKLK